ncbi:MAG TPA: VWA domain-containing protein [Bryobacteraceae bacterium]|nr:VWA domain-containing protein [Bryobacteraceae bacterium]
MTFDRPWVLLFVLLPLAWAAWEWRRSGRRGALLLKAASIAAVLAALAQPVMTIHETKVALGILVDTSSSMAEADLERASALATRIQKGRGRHWVQIFPFARTTRQQTPDERTGDAWKFHYTAGPGGKATNIEAAVRDAVASLPAGHVPRLLLFSDGHDNLGSVSRAMWQAQQLQVPIDTVSANGRPRPALLLESVTLPSLVFSGERFPIDVAVSSPAAATAKVEIAAEGKTLGTSNVELTTGINRFRVHANLNTVGAIELAGVVSAPGLGEAHFDNALTLRGPRVLLVTRDPEGTEVHLVRTLEANQASVTRAPAVPEKLDDYQLVILNNMDAQGIPLARKKAIEEFARQGGGVLWIAGERNVYVEKKPEDEDELDRTLPAKLAPPRTPEGTAVVLIVDKSSSMEGRKMELARQAAIGVVENLRPIDSVGVLIFDNSFQWAVPIRKAEDRALIKRLIGGIMPDGGTQIAPALQEAYRRILPQRAIYKHVVLLTDGISEEGDSMTLAREAGLNRVTISTVGLGQDVNRAYLEKVAQLANGRAHMVLNPEDLEQILLRDVQEHTGSTAVEKPIRAAVLKQAEILDGVGIEKAPALRGYVRFVARPTADTILGADQNDPLLVRWQYGLGRAAVFTSDAKSRWAANWVNWPGFDRLWTNIFRDLLPHAHASEGTAEFDRASDELVVEYRLGRNVRDPATVPDIFAFGPDGFQKPLKVVKMAAGYYRARLPMGQQQGLFRVRPLAESRAFPEVGFYRQEDELTEYGSNTVLLEQLAKGTGGRYNPAIESVFDPVGRSIQGTMVLWPGLLALAILLNLVEIVLRKWKGMLEGLGIRRSAEAARA